MSVHFLAMHSPTGSPIRALLTPDGLAHPWTATAATSRRVLSMNLVTCAPTGGEDPVVFVDAEGRHWIHPAHRTVVLRDEQPVAPLRWFSRKEQAQA